MNLVFLIKRKKKGLKQATTVVEWKSHSWSSFLLVSGSSCSEPCPEGLWGPHCNQSCFKNCPNSDTCQKENGECVCHPGYWGITCQNSECWNLAATQGPQTIRTCRAICFDFLPFCLPECRAGMYGEQCSMSCPSCGESYRCNHVTGECYCPPGYTGPNCNQGEHE